MAKLPKVVIYTKDKCMFSRDCKNFFDVKNVKYTEISIDNDPENFAQMKQKSKNRSTTPQVFINNEHIGSFDDIKALESLKKLDKMLNLDQRLRPTKD